MKRSIVLISLCLLNLPVLAQSVQVVQLEHSLRWVTEYNFPYYLDDPLIEESVKNGILISLPQILPNRDITLPAHFNYRVISWFGKTKVRFPKTSSSDYQVAITSAITRATVGYAVLWNMQIQIKQNKRVLMEREVSHELEPYSSSIRFSNHPWMDAWEFRDIFLFMFSECLGITVSASGPITLGSIEQVREKIESLMTIGKEYRLVVAGAMMNQSRSNYLLMRDSLRINEFSYKPTDVLDFNFSFSAKEIFADLFKQISGIDTYYTLRSKEYRTGTIFNQRGLNRQVRLDWLEENIISAEDEIIDSKIISPITGLCFDQDSMISHFIFYKEIRPLDNITMHDLQFQMDEDLDESIYAIVGEFRGINFRLEYREFDELILIKFENRLIAVLSLINDNPESLSSGGVKLTKNKTFMVPSTRLFGKSKINESSSERYPLYTIAEMDDEGVIEMGYFLLLLFFAIGNVG